MQWTATTERIKAAANDKARQLGPLIEKLRAEGLTLDATAAELNRRGFRSVKGARLTKAILRQVKRRWEQVRLH